jgi:hypothetical protein
MTGGTVPGQDSARRMSAIATGLVAAGLAAAVHDTRGVLDVTATFGPARRQGHRGDR